MLGLVSHPHFASADRHSQRMSPSDIGRFIMIEVAREFALDSLTLAGGTRGSPSTALARQVAMYLAHVVFALDFVATGRVFKRDRTTVAHACRVVENRRDDLGFDMRITALESACVISCDGGAR